MLTKKRNYQNLKTIARRLPKLEPKEILKSNIICEDNQSMLNDADLKNKFYIFNMGVNCI